MIKKILIIIFISTLVTSCGKKNCPKNNETEVCNELFKKT